MFTGSENVYRFWMFTGSENVYRFWKCLQVLKMFTGSETVYRFWKCLQVLKLFTGSVRKITIENDQDLLLTASNQADTSIKNITRM